MALASKIALAGVSFVALMASAHAQEAQPSDDASYDTNAIIVEARRKDEALQDVPVTINAVTSETIEKLNLRQLEDITRVVPGLQLQANANGVGTTAVVRGVKYDVNASGNNGTIAFYRNNVPTSSGALFQTIYDIGQIEVLRGPQGTLRGRAAPSGAITITTRKPDLSEPGGYMTGTLNDIGGWNFNGGFGTPIIADKLAIRLAGLVSESEGNRVTSVRRPGLKGKGDTDAIRISAAADPFNGVLLLDGTYERINTDRAVFDQMVSAQQFSNSFGPSPVALRGKDRKSYVYSPRSIQQEYTIYSWHAQLNLFGQSLNYTGGDLRSHLNSLAPNDFAGAFSSDLLPVGSMAIPASNRQIFGRNSDTYGSDTSHEILLQNNERIAGLFDYVVGYFHLDSDSDTLLNSPVAIVNSTTPPVSLLGVSDRSLRRFGTNTEESFFGNLTVYPVEGLEIAGGLRHIKYTNNAALRVFFTQLLEPGGYVDAFPEDDTFKKTIYTGSIKYRFTPDLMVYASTGTSWRPSAIAIGGPSALNSDLQSAFLRTDPETSTSYEVGLKSEWFDRRLTFNLTAYHQKFKNYPYRAPGIGVYAIDRSNVPRGGDPRVVAFNYLAQVPVTVKGVEAEINFQATPNWNIGATVSYSDGKIKNGSVPCLDLDQDGVPDQVSTAPTLAQLESVVGTQNISACNVTQRSSQESPFGFTVQSEYSVPLSNSVNGVLRGLFTYKGNSIGDPTNPYDRVKSYGLLDLFVGVRSPDGSWEVTAYGKNLFDTYRYTTSDTSAGVLATSTALGNIDYTNYFGVASISEREFGLTARIAFGSR
jgi:iron complex outermembrane receptor protein